MGVDKAMLKINDVPMLEISVQNLEKSGAKSIHILVKDERQAEIYRSMLGQRVSFHLDPPDTKGPWEVLVAILQQLKKEEIVQLLPVDAPWFDDIAIGLLQRQMELVPESDGALPKNEHGSHPLLAQFHSGKILELLLSQPPQSLRSLFKEGNLQFVNTDDFHKAGCHPNCLLNLNRREDFPR
ncbi:MAG TPA: NTP transferase domain-containing protein [Candidatus Thalassarchaeaceae archaeon]|nr:MAG TPA: hypothetical protein D7H94_05970 [Candidatus Poseidoniales archaeon]HIH84939.1 NTP transferase domain-containing protein [Candidatus Thalassarchaeaceae archaeon]